MNRLSIVLLSCISILLLLGLLMIYDITATEILDRKLEVSTQSMFLKQLFISFAAILCGIALYLIGYKKVISSSYTLLWIGGALLFLVYFPHIGKQINGAHRWISIFGVSCQPSEFMKYIIPMFFIFYCKQHQGAITWPVFCRLFGIIAFFIGLIIFEPDNGTAAILFMQLLVLFFLAKINWKYWVIPLCCLFSVAASFAIHMKHVPDRIRIYLHPELDILGKGHQPYQAKLAAGSGGMYGKGFGASIQKFNYLPEAKSDYIAAIYAEEFGFIGMLFLILLYMLIALIGFYIALHAKDMEGFYLASVITFTICFQAFLNLGVVSTLLPSKGTNLPFFSQGGSSLFANALALALLLDIHRKSEQKKSLPLIMRTQE